MINKNQLVFATKHLEITYLWQFKYILRSFNYINFIRINYVSAHIHVYKDIDKFMRIKCRII